MPRSRLLSIAVVAALTGCSENNPQTVEADLSGYYTRDEVNASFATVGSLQAVSDRVAAGRLIPNGDFRTGLAHWQIAAGPAASVSIANVAGSGPVSDSAAINVPDVSSPTWVTNDTWIPLDRSAAYRVTAQAQVASGNFGSFFVAVRLRDAAGTEIGGDSAWWFHAVSNQSPADSAWRAHSAAFGAGTDHPFPAGAESMTVGFILNADPGDIAIGGNRAFHIQGLDIVRSQGLRPHRLQAAVGTKTTGQTLGSLSFYAVAGEPVTLTMSCSGRPNAAGHTYASMYLDGALVSSAGESGSTTWRRTMSGMVSTTVATTGTHTFTTTIEVGSGATSFADGVGEWPQGGLTMLAWVGE